MTQYQTNRIVHLRHQADQCRKLARSTLHPPTAAMFEQMAIEYETQATHLSGDAERYPFIIYDPETADDKFCL
ncbi:hypothetical protein IC614_00285 [Allosphingosinicella flava]|uniref:Uncharacterized protein n=1 Tax=Allosphingosinicella flava TaxID=2771430 RepID=A0A7T2LM81_9SPHN|nr:hypothetical protein [Sphingosinicella flava]QPQ55103.1 hypothetical protein IC614_00285 [Sphingosinicella flava]